MTLNINIFRQGHWSVRFKVNMLQTCYVVILLLMSLVVKETTSCPNTCKCDSSHAMCSGSNIHDVVMGLSPGIQNLEVENSVQPQSLSSSVLKSGSSIVNLKITGGNIQEIADNAFESISNLVTLNLSRNAIFRIGPNAFHGLSYLKELDLSGNNIVTVGDSFQSLKQLQWLDLSHNQISSFTINSFKQQGALQVLNLQGNNLQTIQGYMFQGLGNLQDLNLRHCQLSSFSGEVFHLSRNLQVLDIGDNMIQDLPSISELNQVPASLQKLLVDHNRIPILKSHQFSGLNLLRLDLSHNMISGIADEVFSHFNVGELDLSFNIISAIQHKALQPIAPHLEDLNLAGNPLQVIPPSVFNSIYQPFKLRYLNLSRCSLKEIHPDQFGSLYSLRALDISRNNLHSLPTQVLGLFKQLQVVSMEGNPWQCNCHILPLRNWITNRMTQFQLCSGRDENCPRPICSGPPRLRGVQIFLLQDQQIRKCDEEDSDSVLGAGAIAGIVIGCLVFLAILGAAIFCYLRCTHRGCLLRKCKGESSRATSHDDNEKECTPFQNSDRASLNESDKDFVVKRYFSSMKETRPSAVSRGSPTFTYKDDDVEDDNVSNASACTGVNSVFTFKVGYESTV